MVGRLLAIAGLISALVAPTAFGSTPPSLGPPAVVSPSGAGAGRIAFDATSATGIAVWNGPAGGGDRAVFGRRVGPRGRPVGPIFRASTAPQAQAPEVTFNRFTREYLVVWNSGAGTSPVGLLRGRSVSVLGEPLGESDGVLGEVGVGRVAAAGGGPDGGFLVAFTTPSASIRARTIDRSGAVTSETPISPRSDCGESPVAEYRSRADEYLVGFSCGLPEPAFDPPAEYVQRVSASGAEVGPEVTVVPPNFVDRGKGSGEVALAYNDRRDEFLFAGQSSARILTRRLSGTGQPIGDIRRLRRTSYKVVAGAPMVDFDSRTGRYLVAWLANTRGRELGTPSLFLARVDERGLQRGPTSARARVSPAGVAGRGPAGGFLVGLFDDRRALVSYVRG